MTASSVLLYALIAVAGTIVTFAIVRLMWRAIGLYRISRAGPRPLRASRHVLWRDPGRVAHLDLQNGPGGHHGTPVPPYRFIDEHLNGSQPCVSVHDARGRRWRVKWGDEVQAENFAVRLAWACGYFAVSTYFVPSGAISDLGNLQRARACIREDGSFRDARFQLDDPLVTKMFEEHSWAWNDNPFVGTPPLQGLKILVMLLSDWDTKDRRDVARGSNTAIFEHRTSPLRREARYLISDWGGSMGRWGANIVTRGRWDPEGFEAQTPAFVTGTDGNTVNFGYSGQRTADIAGGITISHVAWLHQYLGRITDAQIRDALEASGATSEERDRFTRAIRIRIDRLGGIRREGSS